MGHFSKASFATTGFRGHFSKASFATTDNSKLGFTLIETLIACGIMVMGFAMLAIIFGKAYDITGSIKRGSKNERWGAYLMNTILYGPGKTATEGLIAAYRVYNLADTNAIFPSYTPISPSFLCFSTSDKKPVIYELVNEANSLYRNPLAGNTSYDHTKPNYFDLKPTYAKEGKLEIYYNSSDLPHSSGFYFFKENNTPATTTSEIKRIGIKLVIKNALQSLNNAIVLYQNVRIRNLYSLE